MAKKKRAKRAPKSQGITINWAIVGLVVVIALLIGLWQINGKPQSQAAEGNWPRVVTDLSADVRLDGDVNLSWKLIDLSDPAYKVVGYQIKTLPAGATTPQTFDISASQVNSTVLQGQKGTRYYATIMDGKAMMKAASGKVWLVPIMQHPVYAPNNVAVEYAGATTNAVLTY